MNKRPIWNRLIRPLVIGLIAGVATPVLASDGVKVYRVPKERRPPPATTGGLVPVSESVLPRLTYETPAGWTEEPAGQMRLASFKVRAADKVVDVSVIPLPGAAGGDLPNVNRWRSQVGLDPVSETELAQTSSQVQLAGQAAVFYEVFGTNVNSGDPTRVLGAIQHRDGMAWFFKMIGDDQLVLSNRTAFLDFLKTVKFVAPAAGELPPDHPPVDGTSPATTAAAPATGSGNGKLKWTIPAGWQEVPGGQFLYAKFTLAGEGGKSAAVNVSTSVGDGGGLAANVNRWRSQLGQSPWSEAELASNVQKVTAAGNEIAFVEMSGKDARTGQPSSLVGAVVLRGSAAWFFKLMGDDAVIAAQKAAFVAFVKGVEY